MKHERQSMIARKLADYKYFTPKKMRRHHCAISDALFSISRSNMRVWNGAQVISCVGRSLISEACRAAKRQGGERRATTGAAFESAAFGSAVRWAVGARTLSGTPHATLASATSTIAWVPPQIRHCRQDNTMPMATARTRGFGYRGAFGPKHE